MKSKLTVYDNGDKVWKLPSGNFHREDSPALEYASGTKHWCLYGREYTEKEYKYKTRSKKLELLL